jgi:hypothetical protein
VVEKRIFRIEQKSHAQDGPGSSPGEFPGVVCGTTIRSISRMVGENRRSEKVDAENCDGQGAAPVRCRRDIP